LRNTAIAYPAGKVTLKKQKVADIMKTFPILKKLVRNFMQFEHWRKT